MRFRVDRQEGGDWSPVAIGVQASGGRQAIARVALEAGLYRVNPDGTQGLDEVFLVPDWGAPWRVPVKDEGGTADTRR